MKNPCPTCDRARLDKDECSLDCKLRHEYCRHLGIPTGEDASPRRDASSNYRIKSHSSTEPRVKLPKPPKVPRVPKPPNPQRTCPNHPDRPALKYYRECLECVRDRAEKSARAREERQQAREKAKVLKEQAKTLKPPYDWHGPRPMRSKAGRLGHATVCIKEGKGNRETCRLTSMSKNTVAKLRGILEKQNGGPFLCSCGRPAIHKGPCSCKLMSSFDFSLP